MAKYINHIKLKPHYISVMEKVFNNHTSGSGRKGMVKTDAVPQMMRELCDSWEFPDDQLNEVIGMFNHHGIQSCKFTNSQIIIFFANYRTK